MRLESTATTDGVRVSVTSFYDPARSSPMKNFWFFGYTVEIENEGDEAARLLRRKWTIRNALGDVREVDGEGVVGEQPRLEPGHRFVYTSGCPLDTPFGTMEGHYELVRDDGAVFRAEIARFGLAQPNAVN